MRLPRPAAAACSRFWEWLISPSMLFAAAILSFPPFLFQKNLATLSGEAAAFLILALTRRGTIRLLPSLLMILGVTFFSLLSPHGQILLQLGPLTMTRGALEAGLRRGVTLAGMVFLSQLAMSPNIALPGRAGAFVADMFSVLDTLGKSPIGIQKGEGSARGLISSLDQHLYQTYWSGLPKMPGKPAPKGKAPFIRGLAVTVLLPGILYLLLRL